jgi:alanine racemase
VSIEVPRGIATWVEVRRDALRANLAAVQAHAGVPVCAVVKANGYGHGLVEAARTFADAGAAMLAVSRLEEARAIREAGIDARLLILLPGVDPRDAVAVRAEIVLDDTTVIPDVPPGVPVHLKIDTGMSRLGIRCDRALDAAAALARIGALAGVMTHFANAAQTNGRANGIAQLALFSEVVERLRAAGIDAPAHAANSAAMLALPGARFDLVRIGTLLYGQDPVGVVTPWVHAAPFTWYAKVASVRALEAGASVGYGSEWTASRPTAAATIPVGWADGFATDVVARTPTTRETLARTARTLRAARHDDRHVIAVAHPDGTPLEEPARLPVLGRVAMHATTVADPGGILQRGSLVRIPARRISVSASIPRIGR